MDLQRMLLALGYDAGVADGSAGPRTAEALRAFQRDHGEAPTGEITAETVVAVRSVWLDRNAHGTSMPGPGAGSATDASAAQPSFDCTRAATPTEQRICASQTLAELDAKLSKAFWNCRLICRRRNKAAHPRSNETGSGTAIIAHERDVS